VNVASMLGIPRTGECRGKLFVLVGLDISTLSEEEELGVIGALPQELLLESQPCSMP
jgi:hypothetical protein